MKDKEIRHLRCQLDAVQRRLQLAMQRSEGHVRRLQVLEKKIEALEATTRDEPCKMVSL